MGENPCVMGAMLDYSLSGEQLAELREAHRTTY